MRVSVVWSALRYIASSKINSKPLTYTKYDDFSIIVEKMENLISRTVDAFMPCNKTFIDQASSVKMAGYWPRPLFAFYGPRLRLGP